MENREPIDVVCVLGKGSPWNDNELKYSLRSLEKYVSGYRDVYIIGECPEWLTNIIHIPYKDEHPEKETRIALKILRACEEKCLSDNFMFLNDDHFILDEFNAGELPFYHQGPLLLQIETPNLNHNYKQTLINTYTVLMKNMMCFGNPINYDVHTPIIYNKNKFYSFFNSFDWNKKYSYVVKSLYCNTFYNYKEKSVEELEDLKILKKFDFETLKSMIRNKKFFSISDSAICEGLEILLYNLYPIKSKYEK